MERSYLAIARRRAQVERAAVHTADGAELFLVLGCSALVVILSALPYALAYLSTPPGTHYLGLLSNPLDGNSYLAKMQEGARGSWVFHLPYTAEPHDGAFLYPFYLVLGHLAAFLDLPLVLVYHAARLSAGFVLLLMGYLFIASLVEGSRPRLLTWFLFALGSGLGWLAAPLGYYTSDLLIPEATTFHAVLVNPHFPLATALLIGVFLLMLRASRSRRLAWGAGAALLCVLLVLVQPFLVLTVYVVSIGWLTLLFWSTRRLPSREMVLVGLVCLVSLPAVLLSYLALYENPVLAQWTLQNQTPSPGPLAFILGYGLLSPLALVGLVALTRGRSAWQLHAGGRELAIAWLVVNALLLYAPFALQRRFAEGFQMPVAIFAALGVAVFFSGRLGREVRPRSAAETSVGTVGTTLPGARASSPATIARAGEDARAPGNTHKAPASSRRSGTILGIALVLLTFPTNLFLVGVSVLGMHQAPSGFFVSDDEMQALRWLSQSTSPTEAVLASPEMGNLIPAWAGNRVYYGHPFETIQAEAKRAALESLFEGTMEPGAREEFFQGAGVRYLYYGDHERRLGSFDPTHEPYLTLAFSNARVRIYQVAQ